MKKVFLWASALLLLSACNTFRTQTYQDNLALPLAPGSPDSLLFSISLEYPVKGLSDEALARINNTILTQAFDLEDEAPVSLAETALRYREALIDEYLTENSLPVREGGVYTWEDYLEGGFTENFKEWKNYLLSYYSFRGGAHGLQTLSQIVFDKNTGETLSEADLFVDDYFVPVSALMQKQVLDAMLEEDPELAELLELYAVVPNGNFSVGKDGVQWVFQPYEVGPYVLGIVSSTLSWEQLQPYLK